MPFDPFRLSTAAPTSGRDVPAPLRKQAARADGAVLTMAAAGTVLPTGGSEGARPRVARITRVRVVLVVWLAMVGLDFVLNAAVFAGMYQVGGAFLLAPLEAFRRIPLGYLALLILAAGVVELAVRLGVATIADGVRLGAVSGAVLGAAWSLGLYSIATLSPQVALAFAGIWFALLAVAGGVAAAGLQRSSLRGLTLRVVGIDVVAAIAVIALQSFGVLPTLTP
jgi:hypothetical protein